MSRLLIDTNILLLYVVGSFGRDTIKRFKRTSSFDADDFDLLVRHIGNYSEIVVTGAILAEISNLLPDYLHEAMAPTLMSVVNDAVEEHAPAAQVVADRVFPRLGFTDSGIVRAANDRETTVMTDDVQLYLELLARERAAVNFNHLRAF
jgi:hypothetical protein